MTRQLRGIDVEVVVDPVEVDGARALVTVDYRVAPGDADVLDEKVNSFASVLGEHQSADEVVLVDGANENVLPVAQSAEGSASDFSEDDEAEGYAAQSRGVFAAPGGESVDVLIPSLGYVTDVPVVPAGAGFESAVQELGDPTDPEPYELRAYSRTFDESTTTDVEGDEVTMALASDVLFEPSSAELPSDAVKVVERAAERVQASAEGGQISVIGHTDDVDTDEFNQKLSEDRAETVASRLGDALGNEFTISAEGRGEREPVAEGTSEEARAANRRVEIVFDGRLVQDSEPTASNGLPETDAPVGRAGEPVHPLTTLGDADYTVTVDSFTRSHGAVFGTLEIELMEGDEPPATMYGILNADQRIVDSMYGRQITVADQVYSAMHIALLTDEGRTFPFDYDEAPGKAVERQIVGDRSLTTTVEEVGETTLVTAVWPDTGQDEVTLEVPGKFRITDIPVTEGSE